MYVKLSTTLETKRHAIDKNLETYRGPFVSDIHLLLIKNGNHSEH
jgi:hypothetical protein